MKHVVKYDMYMDILLMVSIYVIKYVLLRGNTNKSENLTYWLPIGCLLAPYRLPIGPHGSLRGGGMQGPQWSPQSGVLCEKQPV